VFGIDAVSNHAKMVDGVPERDRPDEHDVGNPMS